jgi:hypothetical protein
VEFDLIVGFLVALSKGLQFLSDARHAS